jgi:hypothetical protein
VPPTVGRYLRGLRAVAIRVQLGKWLSLIPGWAGFAAPKPELGVEQKGARRSPLFYLLQVLPRRLKRNCPSLIPAIQLDSRSG